MRAFAVMTFALACLVCAYGQSAAPVTIAAAQDDHGRPGWSATNTGTATVTAFAFTHERRFSAGSKALKATIVRIYDAATEPLTAKPVPPGQTVRASFAPAGGGSPATPQLRAVIFAGGGSWGDPVWAQRITQRRAYMRQSLKAALADLNAAAASGVTTREGLVAQFQAALAAEQSAAANRDQQSCIHSVRGIVLKNLQLVNQAGAPFPLKTVLQYEMGALGKRLAAVEAGGDGH